MADHLIMHCNLCARETRHEILREYVHMAADNEAVSFQTVRCAGCETISFYEEHSVEAEQGWEITEVYIYPIRQYKPPCFFESAPENLDRLYRDTVDAFNNSSLVLCAGGLRALVEGVCADQGITDGPSNDGTRRGDNLECKINGLAERNTLTNRQAEILHEHRYLGNRALHQLDVPAKETLEIAIGLIEHIMEDLYNVPTQADNLRRLRQNPPKLTP